MAVVDLALIAALSIIFCAADSAKVVVRGKRAPITADDIEFAAMQQGITADKERSGCRPKLAERLIERQLVRAFLASRKFEPVADELQFQISEVEEADS